jgi:hypothetical protein
MIQGEREGMSKAIPLLVMVFALAIILSPIPLSQSPEYPRQDAQVYVDPVSISEPVETTFDITVGIADVVNLGGFGVIFGWDPAVLEYVSHTATPDAVLNPVVLPVADTVDATAGTYELAAATLGGGGFTGSGTIFSLSLKVIAEGLSPLEFLLHDLADADAIAIPHTTLNGTFDNRPSVEQYELVIGVSGSGTTDPVPGTYLYDAGTEVSVTAIADGGWLFDYWLLDGIDVGSTYPYVVTMNANHTLTAVFVREFQFVIDVVGSGTTNPAPGSYLTKEGTDFSVDALPAAGWTLDPWLLDGEDVGSTDPYLVTMDANHTLTAVFVEIPVGQVTIESSDSQGAEKDTFDITENVYFAGTGYAPLTVYNISIVEDVAEWVDGMPIPSRVPGTETTVTSNATGDIPVTLIWSSPLTVGQFDIIVDVDGDGNYTEGIDALDSDGLGTTAGFFVIPEFWLGTILGLAGCFAALGVLIVRKRRRMNGLKPPR